MAPTRGSNSATLSRPSPDDTTAAQPVSARSGIPIDGRLAFLDSVSHELRTPLNGVLGALDLLAGAHLDDEARAYLDAAREAGERLRRQIDEIIGLAALDSGQLALEPTPTDMVALVRNCLATHRARFADRGILLTLRAAPEVPETVVIDASRLQHILSSVLEHVLTSNRAAAVAIELSSHQDGPQVELRLAIAATGLGQDGREWAPDASLDTGDAEFECLGVRLALCRRLARCMGGDLALVSAPGHGACFTVTVRAAVDGPGADDIADGVAVSSASESAPEPIIDAAVIAQLRELDHCEGGLLDELFGSFLADAEQKVLELRANPDPELARSVGLGLRAASAHVGAQRITTLAAVLARARQPAQITAMVDGLARELIAFRTALAEELEEVAACES